jgi:hypothetical protein
MDEDYSMPCLRANAKFFGAVIIWLTQVIGPMVMLVTNLQKSSEWRFSLSPWETHFGDRLLGFMLVCTFNLNAFFEATREAASWEKISSLFTFVGCGKKRNTSYVMLYIGAATNCYVFITSCCCTTLLLGNAEGTKDILFDALGILFLYNLDDISSGQLGFVGQDDWPGHRLAWMYGQIESENDECPAPGAGRHLYKFTRVIILMLGIILPAAYVVTDFGGSGESN